MIHEGINKEDAYKRALEVVEDVKLPDPERILKSFPHQLSGGQQQRIVIAMALMSKPSLLILDEPTTALDVTVEAAVVKLVKDLGKKYGTSMLFISHNLGLNLRNMRPDLCDVFRRSSGNWAYRRCIRQNAAPIYAGVVSLYSPTRRR